MQAPLFLNAFKNSLATCAKSQKNSCDISKLFRRAWRCDDLIAAVHTFNMVPHASRSLFISASNFSFTRDDINAAYKLRV